MKIILKPVVWLVLLTVALVLWLGGYFSVLYQHEQTHSHTLINHLQELRKFEVLQAGLIAHQSVSQSSYLKLNHDQFVIVAQAKAIYGIDFSKGVKTDIKQDQIKISLPPVELFGVIMNPDSFEYIGISKGWFTSQGAFEELKHEKLLELHQQMKEQAQNKSYFEQGETQAHLMIEVMLKTLGFKEITIEFQKASPKI